LINKLINKQIGELKIMKKNELKNIIREEIERLEEKEAPTQKNSTEINKADFKNLNG
jgi:hypothetical protein